jgi:Flp pilus assembly protein TadG
MSFSLLRVIWRDIQGSATTEAAAILPVLLLLFCGVFEFSWYFYEQHRVSTGIRDAARYIARTANPPSDATVQSNAKSIALSGDTSGSCTSGTPTTCRVKGWTDPASITIDPTVSVACTAPYYCQGGATTMQGVKVSTSFTPSSLGFLGFLRLGSLTINISHTERIVVGGA